MHEYTPAEDQFIVENKGSKSWAEIGEELGLTQEAVRNHWRNQLCKGTKQATEKVQPQPTRPSRTIIEDDNGKTIHSIDEKIKTVDELVEACGIDLEVYRISSSECKAYQGFYHDEKTGTGRTVQMYSVKARFVPIAPAERNAKELREQLIADMDRHAPKYRRLVCRPKSEPIMAELDLPDHHWGKLAWVLETGDNYDLKIASARFREAFNNLLDRVAIFKPEKIVIPLGHDLFNGDDEHGATTAGTAQDTEGRWSKCFIEAKRVLVECLDAARLVAPVLVAVVPGNHDRQKMFYMGDSLSSWYRNCPDVTVDNGPDLRKYIEYGQTLIGFTHGSDEKPNTLPLIMARERESSWSKCRYKEWHIGHLHKKREHDYNAGDTFNGVRVRVSPSLCGTDSWHYRNGYVRGQKAAEAFVYSRGGGMIANLIYNAE